MLILMQPGSSEEDLGRVIGVVRGLGCVAETTSFADGPTGLLVSGYGEPPHADLFERLPGVARVLPVTRPLRHVAGLGGGDRQVRIGSRPVGGGAFSLVAGPCAVESADQLLAVAHAVRDAGADFLRGGAYKPRTSPYDFQGLGEEGLELLARAREETGLPVITEALDERSLERVERFGDVIQIGARNMQNFALLQRAGRSRLPVLLKRGMSARLEDLLFAAEYLLDAGNPNVILCERGIRTFSDHSRYTLDLSVVPALKRMTHLPIFVDPSHASGDRRSVPPLARAALAAGADGVMVEVHPEPALALSDGAQSLSPTEFAALAASLRTLAPFIVRGQETVC